MTSIAMIITGKIANSETFALFEFLDRAAHLEAIAGRQRAAQLLEVGRDLARHVGRLHAVANVAAHSDREVAVAAPRDRILVVLLDMRDL